MSLKQLRKNKAALQVADRVKSRIADGMEFANPDEVWIESLSKSGDVGVGVTVVEGMRDICVEGSMGVWSVAYKWILV